MVTACASSATESPDSTDSAVRAPTPLIFSELPERAPLVLGAETEQQMRVLAHDQMGEQRHALAGRRKVVERAHRHVDLVRDALHVEQELRRILLDEDSGESADHGARTLFGRLSHAGRLARRAWASGAGSRAARICAAHSLGQRRQMPQDVVQRRKYQEVDAQAVSSEGECRSGTMIGIMPAASAARTPGSESSSTMQAPARVPSRRAASR